MKIILTGSLGHIGKPLTETLVQKGHAVTVISSKPGKQKDIEALGATAAIGSVEDAAFLTATFTGADAVYTMVPPVNYFDHSIDIKAYYIKVSNNYVEAVEQSGVKRVVHLSSIGAHLDKDSGLILAHHAAEGILDTLANVDITFMRPVAFYYNLLSFVPAIKKTGTIASNYGGDDRAAWVSPADIAAAIAEELETPLSGKKVRYVASDEPTCSEIAGVLGAAIGKPDLKWITISDEQLLSGLAGAGMPAQIAADFVDMNAAMHNGKLFEDYHRNRPVMGKVKITDFAKEFAAVYNQK